MITEIIIIAACIFAEAEGEGIRGRELVADVIANRASQRGMTAVQVVQQPHQFSGVSVSMPEIQRRSGLSPDVWEHCVALSEQLYSGTYIPTTRYTHFYAPALLSKPPSWAGAFIESEKIGNHIFGKIK